MGKFLKGFISICCCLIFTQPLSISADEIASQYYVLMDAKTSRVIEGKGEDDLIYPASMTKIMTLLVAVEQLKDLDEKITITDEMLAGLAEANASVAGFVSGETVSVRDLFYGLMLPSGADACVALAVRIAGSEEAYVELMNERAAELGLTQTHFVNTTGLHEDAHVSTVKEIALLLKAALRNPGFKNIFETKEIITETTWAHPEGIYLISSTFRYADPSMDYLIGGKTGFTYEAGLCLASAAEKENMSLILVTAKAPVELGYQPIHIQDAKLIYDKAFDEYHQVVLLSKDEALPALTIKEKFKANEIDLKASETITAILPKTIERESCSYTYLNESLTPPITQGELIQTLTITCQGEAIASLQFTAEENIEKDLLFQLFTKENTALLFVILCAVTAFVYRFLHRRDKINNEA